jgi:Fe-S-cluster containining protein
MAAPASSLSVFQLADQWFDQARTALQGALPCRHGCSACCIGPFPITQLDVLELQRGLSLLPLEQRRAIENRAAGQVNEIERAYPALRTQPTLDQWKDEAIDRLTARFGDRPCPALQADGSCAVYAFRPITCRMTGIPTETEGLVQGACSVQTAVPVVRVPERLRQQEDAIAEREAEALAVLLHIRPAGGEEVLLPYGFLPDRTTSR